MILMQTEEIIVIIIVLHMYRLLFFPSSSSPFSLFSLSLRFQDSFPSIQNFSYLLLLYEELEEKKRVTREKKREGRKNRK